jgi:hypothetical protein
MRRLGQGCWLAAAALLAAPPIQAFWWGPSVESRWLDRAVSIDGGDEDWKSIERDDSEGLGFAFANDGKNIYLLVAPHTKSTKDQMAGSFGEKLTVWLDPQAGRNKKIGLKLASPEGLAHGERRPLEMVGLDTAAAACGGLDAVMGPKNERGVLEARIPLACLGGPLQRISVGLETSAPTKPPARPHDDMGRSRRRETDAEDDAIEPIQLWIRVHLASAPSP